jgi:hypothetical protein
MRVEDEKRDCPHCGRTVDSAVRFCGACGQPLDGPQDMIPHAAPPVDRMDTSPPVSRLVGLLSMAVNPGGLLRAHLDRYPWYITLAISGLAFTLLFLQIGLDLLRMGALYATEVLVLCVLGALYGTLGIALLALLAWLFALPFGRDHSAAWTVRAFGLSYSPALIYGALGLCANVALGWNTAVAFGVTGVLWALGPMIAALRELAAGKLGASIALSTLCGALLLLSWAWFSTGWL